MNGKSKHAIWKAKLSTRSAFKDTLFCVYVRRAVQQLGLSYALDSAKKARSTLRWQTLPVRNVDFVGTD